MTPQEIARKYAESVFRAVFADVDGDEPPFTVPTTKETEAIAALILEAAREIVEGTGAVEALSDIINGCVHPDRAERRVMVELAPIRAALTKLRALTTAKA